MPSRDDVPVLRSHLYAPGSSDKLLAKVLDAGADCAILDLEDAVAPERKVEAREKVAALVAERALTAPCAVHVRIDRGPDGIQWDDVHAVVQPGLAALRVPKTEDPQDLVALDRELTRLEQERGIEAGSIGLYPLLESALGILRAGEIAAASPRIHRMCVGAADLGADLGLPLTAGSTDADPLAVTKQWLVLQSAAAGIGSPVSPVDTNLDDLDGLRRSTIRDRAIGMVGRACIHPAQVAVVHDVFTPSAGEIEKARTILDAADTAARDGVAAIRVGGVFVDPAVVRRARQTAALAALADQNH